MIAFLFITPYAILYAYANIQWHFISIFRDSFIIIWCHSRFVYSFSLSVSIALYLSPLSLSVSLSLSLSLSDSLSFALSLSSYLVLAGSQPPLSDIYGSTMAGYWCVWKINGNGRRKGNCPFASSPRKIELSRLSRLCVSIIHSSDLYWPLIEVFMVLLWYHLVEIDSFVLLCRLFAVFCCRLTIPV